MRTARHLAFDVQGSVSISAAWLSGIFIVLFGSAVEMAYSYWQSNALQHAAKHGVRIATTTSPVADDLTLITGLEGGAEVGDPMPDYQITCYGKTLSCTRGTFNQDAFDKIFYGLDNDGTCLETTAARRGMCDMFGRLRPENITITYQNSGMGRAGTPPDLIPVVTVSISQIQQNYLFVDFFKIDSGATYLGATALGIAEDME